MNLFIDTSNNKLILLLEKDDKIIDILILEKQLRVSEIAIEQLQKFLENNKLTLKDIERLYATIGPGSYTGVRVAITIIKTLKLINNKYRVFLLSSLAFQAGIQNVISLLDARGDNSYLGIFSNGQNIITEQLIPNDLIEEFSNQFKDYIIIKDYQEADFQDCFLKLKNQFKEVDDLEKIEPLYIKHFI